MSVGLGQAYSGSVENFPQVVTKSVDSSSLQQFALRVFSDSGDLEVESKLRFVGANKRKSSISSLDGELSLKRPKALSKKIP